MMTRSFLATVGSVLIAAAVLGGCYMPPSSVQAPPTPPPAPMETVSAQPGPSYVWVPGTYTWQPATRTYVWVPGHWTVPPRGYVWVPGHWETHSTGNQWVDGYWRPN